VTWLPTENLSAEVQSHYLQLEALAQRRLLRLVETDEIANPVSVGFLSTDAVIIHTNNGMNLIA